MKCVSLYLIFKSCVGTLIQDFSFQNKICSFSFSLVFTFIWYIIKKLNEKFKFKQ